MTTKVRMTKTAATPAASAALGGAPATHQVTDERGRVLTVKKLTALDRMRLAIAVGAETAANDSAMFYANLAASLVGIDGETEAPVQSMVGIQARVQRLDEDGLTAILRGWAEAGWLGTQVEGADPQAAHEDAVKN